MDNHEREYREKERWGVSSHLQKKYVVAIISLLIAFVLGYISSFLQSRGDLRNYKFRANEYLERLRDYQAREAEFDAKLTEYANQLKRSREEAARNRAESIELRKEIERLRKPIGDAGSSVESAIGNAQGLAEPIDRIEVILRAVQKRDRSKN